MQLWGKPLCPWVSVEDASGNLVQSVSVITAPKDDLIDKRSERLLGICNDLVVFHLFQYFFHWVSVYLHNHFSLVYALQLKSAGKNTSPSTPIHLSPSTALAKPGLPGKMNLQRTMAATVDRLPCSISCAAFAIAARISFDLNGLAMKSKAPLAIDSRASSIVA
jgi:hypothetical protein